MKIVIIIILILSNLSCLGQKKIAIGLFANPSIERRVWNGDDWIDFKPKASFNFGVSGKYNLNEKFILYSGLGVYDKGAMIKENHVRHPPIVSIQDTVFTRTIGHLWYLSVPVSLKRIIHHYHKLQIYGAVGGVYGRRLWNFKMMKNIDGKFYNWTPYSSDKYNFWAGSLGLGIIYDVNPHLSLEVSPNYIRQLTRGWGESTLMDNKGHYDSFVLDMILWWRFWN